MLGLMGWQVFVCSLVWTDANIGRTSADSALSHFWVVFVFVHVVRFFFLLFLTGAVLGHWYTVTNRCSGTRDATNAWDEFLNR